MIILLDRICEGPHILQNEDPDRKIGSISDHKTPRRRVCMANDLFQNYLKRVCWLSLQSLGNCGYARVVHCISATSSGPKSKDDQVIAERNRIPLLCLLIGLGQYCSCKEENSREMRSLHQTGFSNLICLKIRTHRELSQFGHCFIQRLKDQW
jgi:hypothetical protein